MIVLVPDGTPHAINIDKGAPSPALKWAEESYTVIEIRESALDEGDPLVRAIEELSKYEKCTPKDAVGLVG
jgi:carboxymethylenebutenolidase